MFFFGIILSDFDMVKHVSTRANDPPMITPQTRCDWELTAILRETLQILRAGIPQSEVDDADILSDVLIQAYEIAQTRLSVLFTLSGPVLDQLVKLENTQMRAKRHLRDKRWRSRTEPTYLEAAIDFKLPNCFTDQPRELNTLIEQQIHLFKQTAARMAEIVFNLYENRAKSGYWTQEVEHVKQLIQHCQHPVQIPTEHECSICFTSDANTPFVTTGCSCSTARMCATCATNNFVWNQDSTPNAKGRCPICKQEYDLYEILPVRAHSAL